MRHLKPMTKAELHEIRDFIRSLNHSPVTLALAYQDSQEDWKQLAVKWAREYLTQPRTSMYGWYLSQDHVNRSLRPREPRMVPTVPQGKKTR